MELETLLSDKSRKSKEKTEAVCTLLLDGELSTDQLLALLQSAKDRDKGTCIEALEFASKTKPEIITPACFAFLAECLNHKAARVQWESAKIIGNVAHLYSNQLDAVIPPLLINSETGGTVVRWSVAYAFGEMIRHPFPGREELIEALKAVSLREEKNSIKKIYQAAFKKINV